MLSFVPRFTTLPPFHTIVPSFATPVSPEIFVYNTAKVNGPIFFQSATRFWDVIVGILLKF